MQLEPTETHVRFTYMEKSTSEASIVRHPARFLLWGNRLSRWGSAGSWRLAWVLGSSWSRRLSSRCLTTTSFQI